MKNWDSQPSSVFFRVTMEFLRFKINYNNWEKKSSSSIYNFNLVKILFPGRMILINPHCNTKHHPIPTNPFHFFIMMSGSRSTCTCQLKSETIQHLIIVQEISRAWSKKSPTHTAKLQSVDQGDSLIFKFRSATSWHKFSICTIFFSRLLISLIWKGVRIELQARNMT